MRFRAFLVRALVATFLLPNWGALQAQDFDILIRGGRVLDGSGNPDIRADVGIRGDRIVAVGDLREASAVRILDARGRYVVPGFIDMHSHADRALAGEDVESRKAHNLVTQGITTVVVGADGRNARWPISAEIAAYRKLGMALNVVPMVGHAAVRSQVMGDDYERPSRPDEIQRMRELVRLGMEDGAWGLGAAPEYRPGRFSTTEELIELSKVVADYDGFYYAHQRSQSPMPRWQTPSIVTGLPLTGTDGMRETIRIGRESGIRVVGSHIKAKGVSTWGQSSEDILRIDRARREGVQVYLDQYPYATFGGGAVELIPPWAFATPGTDRSGGNDAPLWRQRALFQDHRQNLQHNLSEPETRELLLEDIAYTIDLKGGADRQIIVSLPSDPGAEGKTLAEVAESRGLDPIEMLLQVAKNGTSSLRSGALFRPIAGHDFDVENYMRQVYTATCTDGGISMSTRPGMHPRYYGTFARKLAYYTRDRGVISLPFSIRSSTGLPAQIIGLKDRGHLLPGYRADVVVFDYERIQDHATIMEPDRYSEGIVAVIVNGQFVVDGGQRTGGLPGVVIDRNESRSP